MDKYGVVVIGYNRVESIKRLMNSLLNAQYNQKVELIISIDNSGTNTVEEYAKKIEWPFGEKIIKTYPERLGLKEHVLTCGNYINELSLDALIVLEDDLVVSPGFFNYVTQAVEKYEEDDKIAGISLYSHSWNVNADRPFIPIEKGYDVFFMKYPQSWGQVWMKKQWNAFRQWYDSKKYEDMDLNRVPTNVLAWPKSSWLKYHIEYCIDENKYFVYPYHALSSNFADAGTHYAFSTNRMQIPVDIGVNRKYQFPECISQAAVYDAFFENEQLERVLNILHGRLCVDLYGKKKRYNDCDFLLSTHSMPYKIIRTFGLQMRPWEMNLIYDVPGKQIFLYDLHQNAKKERVKHESLIQWVYDTRGEVILKRNFIDIIAHELFNKIRKK